jgi:putative transposase
MRAAPLRPPLAARSRRDRARRLVQLDTVFVNLTPTKAIKHFTAYDPIAKWTVGKAFNRASAQAAAAFPDKIVADMLFPVKAIRVAGGSEFMAELEVACQTKGIALYVLPPRSPANERRRRTLQRCLAIRVLRNL